MSQSHYGTVMWPHPFRQKSCDLKAKNVLTPSKGLKDPNSNMRIFDDGKTESVYLKTHHDRRLRGDIFAPSDTEKYYDVSYAFLTKR